MCVQHNVSEFVFVSMSVAQAHKCVSSCNVSRLSRQQRAQQRLSPSGQAAVPSSRPWKAIKAQPSPLNLPLPLITELSNRSSTEKDRLRWAITSMSQTECRAGVSHSRPLYTAVWHKDSPLPHTICPQHTSTHILGHCGEEMLPYCSDTPCRENCSNTCSSL